MCKIIAVAMQKGGCAKTSVSLNLGVGLARAGKKVLLIDNDPQGNLTASLGYEEPDDMSDTLASIMMKVINEETIENGCGILHQEEGIDLIPGNIELSGLEVLLANVMSRENILKEYLDQIKDQYDYIIIDCMPSLYIKGKLRNSVTIILSSFRDIVSDQFLFSILRIVHHLSRSIGNSRLRRFCHTNAFTCKTRKFKMLFDAWLVGEN